MLRLNEPLGSRPDDGAALESLAAEIAASPVIGLDTEFMRERTYRAQLCLVQVATPGHCACVDPLGSVPLESFGASLAAPGVEKVMHAARQDLEVLWPLCGLLGKVFDTQVAAALAGWPAQIGYAELVRQLLGVTLSKAHTRTDWARRPLSGAQIEYALDDVAHLGALRDALLERLSALGRVNWLEQELVDLGREEHLFVDPERAWERLKGLADLDPWRRSLARLLAAWRERRASERNRPRSWILPDTAVRGIVLRVPRTAVELGALEDVTPGFIENSGADVLALIDVLAPPSPLPPLPGRPRPDPELAAVVKRLGEAVRTAANELHLSPELLATRRDLEAIARGRDDVPPLSGWRGELLGDRLRATL